MARFQAKSDMFLNQNETFDNGTLGLLVQCWINNSRSESFHYEGDLSEKLTADCYATDSFHITEKTSALSSVISVFTFV